MKFAHLFVPFLLRRKVLSLGNVFSHEHIGDEDRWTISEEALENASGSIKLSMNTVDFVRTLSYSINGEECIWHTLTDVCYLCDEGLSKGKRFTGATVGMFAYAGTENDLTVRFTDPIYTEI